MNRRDLLRGTILGSLATFAATSWAGFSRDRDMPKSLERLERRHGGRLGVAVWETQSGRKLSYRGDERFPVCSTFKLLLVAAVLARVDAGRELLDRRIDFDQGALLKWAPVTRLNVGPPGMSIRELCEAALMISDNTAANLLLDTLGGPPALTHWLRCIGDSQTRVDHHEPLSARKRSGSEDTTTPLAMLEDMHELLLGTVLSNGSRRLLKDWLMHNLTGSQTLRMGLPSAWSVGDKTGSDQHTNNDIAIIFPPQRGPLLVTSYYVNPSPDVATRKAVLADVGRLLPAWLT